MALDSVVDNSLLLLLLPLLNGISAASNAAALTEKSLSVTAGLKLIAEYP